MRSNQSPRPFGWRDKLGYLFGDFGNDFTFVFSTTILLKFYTDVIHVPAAAVGAVLMLARFVDAFTDVTMGRICDRSPVTKRGKFRPWILRMCIPTALASFLIYQSGIAAAPTELRIAYLAVTYILWGSVFYTTVNIPYGSMASAISADPGDRQSLSTFRSIGAALAGTVIGVLLPLVVYEKAGGREILIGSRVTMLAALFSILAVLCHLLCYRLTTERAAASHTVSETRRTSVRQMLKNAAGNRALLSIIAATVVMLLAQLTLQSMGGYIYPVYYGNAGAQSVATLAMTVIMLLSAAVARPLSERFGKAELSAAASLFAAVVCIATFFLRPSSVWVFVGLQTLGWLGLGIFSMVSWALITDVIDDCELKNDIREDGSVYALYSFARKLGQAAAAGLVGSLLSLIGYNADRAALQTPPASVLDGLFGIATLLPAFGFLLLSLVLWSWYPLHKKQVKANAAALAEKHKNC